MGAGERALLIENVMGGDVEDAPSFPAGDIRGKWGVPADAPLALYTGTFEAYQGVDMLIDAAAIVAKTHPAVRILVVGGEPGQVSAARARAETAGAAATMIFTGQQPARDIPSYVQASDLLVSPRIRGTNTPLKIYSYLRSGKPIIATNLRTHTQVLSNEVARLVVPEPAPFAAAIIELVDHPERGVQLAAAAADLAATHYSRASYVQRTADAYRRLVHDTPAALGAEEYARR
jgi:glycosyltransferase involved in cell wall biosynthesis